ncbi:hypothetical protein [Luteimonas notoginsengisoli]|uniref:DUF202 domain-containing protein n=1 Tax=Luteimonas notoginsengisoli TaxID=1578200 RepID=A0ABV7UWN2_9GAMM
MKGPSGGTQWHAEETYKGLIQIALSCLRFGIFANGGAAVALLAFIGKENQTAITISSVKAAMVVFIVGVTLGGLAHLTAYLTQLRLYGESALGDEQRGPWRHNNFLTATIVLGAGSVIAFAVGSLCGVAAIQAAP